MIPWGGVLGRAFQRFYTLKGATLLVLLLGDAQRGHAAVEIESQRLQLSVSAQITGYFPDTSNDQEQQSRERNSVGDQEIPLNARAATAFTMVQAQGMIRISQTNHQGEHRFEAEIYIQSQSEVLAEAAPPSMLSSSVSGALQLRLKTDMPYRYQLTLAPVGTNDARYSGTVGLTDGGVTRASFSMDQNGGQNVSQEGQFLAGSHDWQWTITSSAQGGLFKDEQTLLVNPANGRVAFTLLLVLTPSAAETPRPIFIMPLLVDGGWFIMEFRNLVPGQYYLIDRAPEARPDLWSTISTFTANSGVATWADRVRPGQNFYRLRY
jgi:hypothetical protein